MEDVIETYPLNNHPLVSSSLNKNPNSTLQTISKVEILQDDIENQEKVTKSVVEKKTSNNHNTKIQSEEPFDLEVEIGKLKIAIPLSELAKHDIYKQQIKRSL